MSFSGSLKNSEKIFELIGEEAKKALYELVKSREDSEEVIKTITATIESFQIYDAIELGSKEMERDLKTICENYDEMLALANEFIERGVEFSLEGLGFPDPVVARSREEIGKAMRAAMMVFLGIWEYDRNKGIIYW
jgi:hypothetical protein